MKVNSRSKIIYPSYVKPKNYNYLLKKWLKNNPWVSVGTNVEFPLQSKILGTPTEIKNNIWVTGPMTIKGGSSVTLGKYSTIAENFRVVTVNHQLDRADLQGKFTFTSDVSKGPVYIGNNVWCGDNVTVLSGVTIGDGAAIGAGSVVTKDIPPFAVAAGVPARVIKYRFSNRVIKKLLDIGWWHWTSKTIHKNKFFFAESINDQNIHALEKSLDLSAEQEINKIDLTKNNASKWLLDGWSSKEKDGRWVEKNKAGIIFKVKDPKKYRIFSLYSHSFYDQQKMTLYVNGEKVGRILIKPQWKINSFVIKNLKKGVNTFYLFFETDFSPIQIDKNSTDKRKLFCRFIWFELS